MKKVIPLLWLVLLISPVYTFNFLVNIFYSLLPQPVRSAFKGEGLVTDQLHYGFGNCNFTSIWYLNSELSHNEGQARNITNYKFTNPTFSLYGGYIAHVSTPVVLTIYPGWQLESEFGYGGIEYANISTQIREETRSFYISGLSGFNWRIYQSPEEKNFSFILNLGFGYKLHSLIKEQLYYNVQTGIIIVPNILSVSLEYLSTLKGENLLMFAAERFKSKERFLCLGTNFLLSKKYVLKLAGMIRELEIVEFRLPVKESKIKFYGFKLTLLSG